MGVSGSGKTSTGTRLAGRLGWSFYDADDFHPAGNISKMEAGIPLTDDERMPWLASLRDLIAASLKTDHPGVLACSALKESYRNILVGDDKDVQVVYLKGSYDVIWSRMTARPGHFMKPQMLQSQFEALEEPQDALVMDVTLPVKEIVEEILSVIHNSS